MMNNDAAITIYRDAQGIFSCIWTSSMCNHLYSLLDDKHSCLLELKNYEHYFTFVISPTINRCNHTNKLICLGLGVFVHSLITDNVC